jgi:hypothetical protein
MMPAALLFLAAFSQFGEREDFVALLDDAGQQDLPLRSGKSTKFAATESFSTFPSVTIHTLTTEKRRHLDKNVFLGGCYYSATAAAIT